MSFNTIHPYTKSAVERFNIPQREIVGVAILSNQARCGQPHVHLSIWGNLIIVPLNRAH